MLQSLRDSLVTRIEARAAARRTATTSSCVEIREMLTDELEERLRKHWPRKGRTQVISILFARLCRCGIDTSVCLERESHAG